MNIRTDAKAIKKAVNLSVPADLVEEAKAKGVNLSALLEKALREDAARRWREENAKGIADYNRHIEENGIWSDGLRTW
jgi:antitoxin CcdA